MFIESEGLRMSTFKNLAGYPRQEWNDTITEELGAAGIPVEEVPGRRNPNYVAPYDVRGELGQWIFIRDKFTYAFWGDVPLATAEVIATDRDCVTGCMPLQWFSNWDEQPDVATVHKGFQERVIWLAGDKFLVREEGQSKAWKDTLQRDNGNMLLFVTDPSAVEGGKPFIRHYTFVSLKARVNFVVIAKRHRVDFKNLY